MAEKKKSSYVLQDINQGMIDRISEEFGITFDELDFYEFLWERCEVIDEKDIGFESLDDASSAYISGDTNAEEQAFLAFDKDSGLYIICRRTAMIDGSCDDIIQYATKDEEKARSAFESIPYGYRYPKALLWDLKEKLNDPRIWLEIKGGYNGYGFNVELSDRLVIERYCGEDADEIKAAIRTFEEKEAELREKGITIDTICKRRDSRGFLRYYCFVLRCKGFSFIREAPIPSELQHVYSRQPINFFEDQWVEEILKETTEKEAEPQEDGADIRGTSEI